MLKYLKVAEYLRARLKNGEYPPGGKLPSIRVLAQQFGYNKDTIMRALRHLEQEHLLYSLPQSGYYAVGERKENDELLHRQVDFTSTLPDVRYLPYREFSHCINRAVDLYREELFTYGHVAGLLDLRRTMQELFWQQQIFTDTESIYITAGTQQALSIFVMLASEGEKRGIIVEEPSYPALLQLAKLAKIPVATVKRSPEELDLMGLEKLFAEGQYRFFYLIPRFHNPLGKNLSERHKKRLIELSQKYDIYLIEDDYISDLAGDEKALPLYYYDSEERRVIYVKSFSKSFMPGIRIGAVILPLKLRNRFEELKGHYDLKASVLAQAGLNIYLNSGMYQRHLEKTVTAYRRKMNYVRSFFKQINPDILQAIIPNNGIFVYIYFNERINLPHLIDNLKKHNIIVESGSRFYIGCGGSSEMRLCLAGLNKEDIMHGLTMLLRYAREQYYAGRGGETR